MARCQRMVRRVCKQCQLRKVKKAEHVYCSVACSRLGRRKVRPPCPVCRVRPIRPGRNTCGRSCGAKARTDFGREKGLLRMADGRRAANRRRLAALLHDEALKLAAATSPVEVAKVLARVYRKGYSNGGSAAYYHYVEAARTAAARERPKRIA